MRTTGLRAVLFDFGGVLAEEGFFNGLRALAEQQNLDADMLTKEGRRAVHDSGNLTGQGTESDSGICCAGAPAFVATTMR
jgi:hypothetical protein